MASNLTKLATVALAMITIAGCSSDKKQAEAYRANQGQGISAMGESAEFDKAKSPPIAAETHFAAGQLAESQSNFELALQRYEQALKIDPQHASTLYRSAIVYTELKQYPAAIGRWNRYVEASNGAAAGYNNLALTYELAAKPRDAEMSFKKGIAKHPKDQAIQVNYGLMLARIGRVAEADAQLKKVLQPAEAAYNMGSIYEEMGKKEQAKQKYEEALALNPKMSDAQARLAAID